MYTNNVYIIRCIIYIIICILIMYTLEDVYRFYINKARKNLFVCLLVCLSGMAGHALCGMTPCFGHTGVTFDFQNDRPGPGSLRGHFEAARGLCNLFACLSGMAGHALYGMAPCFGHTGVTSDAGNYRPGPGSL